MSESNPEKESITAVARYGGWAVDEFIETMNLGFRLGNVVKYISRAGKKANASVIDDLKKAQVYLNRHIERLECADKESVSKAGAVEWSFESKGDNVHITLNRDGKKVSSQSMSLKHKPGVAAAWMKPKKAQNGGEPMTQIDEIRAAKALSKKASKRPKKGSN